MLIPVPSPLCGVFIGEETIVYCSASAFKAILIRPSNTKAYERVDADGSGYLFGSQQGQGCCLVIRYEMLALWEHRLDVQLRLLVEKEKDVTKKLNSLEEREISKHRINLYKDAYGDGQHVGVDVISSNFEGQSIVNTQRSLWTKCE